MDANTNHHRGEKEQNMFRLICRTAFHGAAILHHTFILLTSARLSMRKYDHKLLTIAMEYGPRYLTYWNFGFQFAFLVASLRCDVAEWKNQKISRHWAQFREIVFHALVFPFTLYVFVIFWSLYLVDREYVYPLVFDTVMPWWLNQAVHSWILIVLVGEILVQPRPYPKPESYYKVFFIAVYGYSVVYHATYFIDGVWLYPFYYLMSWPFIVLWQVKFSAMFQILYELQWPLFKYLYEDTKGKPPTYYNVKIKYKRDATNGFNRNNNGEDVNGKNYTS